MKKANRILLRSLGVAHFLVAIALLPAVALALSYGFFVPLVILPGVTWLGILGWRLLHLNESLRTTLRITHLGLAPFSFILISHGHLILESAERAGYTSTFGAIKLAMGCLAGGLSIVSICVSFSSALKKSPAGKQSAAAGDLNCATLPERSGSGRLNGEEGRILRWTIRCLSLAHFAVGIPILLLAAWWAFSSLRVLPHMSSGTIWTNLPFALGMAAINAGPLTGIGVWMIVLGWRTWRRHPGIRRVLTLTHGIFLLPGILTAAIGFYALRDAARSAARGGGLLGPIGIFPLAAGLGIVILSASTIIFALTVIPKPKKSSGAHEQL